MGNAINMPLADMGVLKKISTYIKLAETIGSIQRQLSSGAVKAIYVDLSNEKCTVFRGNTEILEIG